MKKWFNILKCNFQMLFFVIKTVPSYLFVMLFNILFFGIVMAVVDFYYFIWLYDSIEQMVNSVTPNFMNLIYLFLLLFALRIFNENFITWQYRYYMPMLSIKLNKRMQMDMYKKVSKVELSCYEIPEHYDRFVWAASQLDSRALAVSDNLVCMIRSLISVVVISSIILTLDITAIIVVVLGVLLSIMIKNINIKINFDAQEKLNSINRALDYVNRVLYLDIFAKEIRINAAKELLIDKYDEFVDKQVEVSYKNIKDIFVGEIVNDMGISILFNVAYKLILIFKVLSYNLTIGRMLALERGAATLYQNVHNFWIHVLQLKENSLYVGKYEEFMNYRSKVTNTDNSVVFNEPFEELEFDNVSFYYESNPDVYVLKNVSFKIKKDEKVSLVGYNGAGKTTLIKLLLRFYDPVSGVIRINGRDIKQYELESYRKTFGTVFQDYRLFVFTIAENVWMDTDYTQHEKEVTTVLDKANLREKIQSLPHGIYSPFSREFDDNGIILSGGEEQKVAIARALSRDRSFIILDEPSSALDPESEYDLNQTLIKAANDKTVIFISHRLSTTVMADKIIMLDNGQIIEEGNHKELMELEGKYCEMFRLQAEKYLQV